jgi:hypothetical protein
MISGFGRLVAGTGWSGVSLVNTLFLLLGVVAPSMTLRGAERSAGSPCAQQGIYRIQADIQQGGFLSANPANGYQVEYGDEGFVLRGMSCGSFGEEWSLEFTLEDIGRTDPAYVPGKPVGRSNRSDLLVVDHACFEMHYRNSDRGMRHDILVRDRPSGAGPLRTRLRVRTDLVPMEEGSGINFHQVDLHRGTLTPLIRYASLTVWDAEGDTLNACMRLEGDFLVLLVEDEGATYPITIDPLSSAADLQIDGLQAGERAGASVATAGDVNGDGYSDVIVGMPGYDNGMAVDAGRVMVFHGSASGLSSTPAWTAVGAGANARFGHSVSTAGDVNADGISDVIIGAPGHGGQGGAFVFHGSFFGLQAASAWSALGGEAGSAFGTSVALAGDVNGDDVSDVLVGAPLHNAGGTDRGRVTCYRGLAGAGLLVAPFWTFNGTQDNAQLGTSVAGAGDLNGDGNSDVVIGEPFYDESLTDRGRILVFQGTGTGLPVAASQTRNGPSSISHFGFAVSAAGDMNGDGYGELIAGAPGYSTGRGRVYAFRGAATGIEVTATSILTGTQASARLGASVSLAGDVNGDGYADVVVGSPLYDGSLLDIGRAQVFIGAPGTGSHLVTAYRTYDGSQAGAQLGFSLHTGGDVNGDGVSELLLGIPEFATSAGRVQVYHGGPDLPTTPTIPVWSQQADVANAQMGASVDHAGDVNGDGYADVIVGLPGLNEVRVYYGGPAGLVSTYWSAFGSSAGEEFGYDVGSAGDVNGDGYSDVIIGAYGYSSFQGRAYVFLGSATGLSGAYHWRVDGGVVDGRFGGSVSSAGDVNGDGYSDIIVGAFLENIGGVVYAYYGSAAGLATTASWSVVGSQLLAWFGAVVSNAGDVDADGYDDVLISAHRHDNAGLGQCGAVFLYRGSSGGLLSTPNWTQYGDQAGVEFGYDLGFAGDVNGDGFSDVIIGAYQYDNGQANEGRSFVYHGSLAGLSLVSAWSTESDFPGAYWGSSAASAGDVNGDGYGDVIVGGYRFAQGYLGEGRACIYQGSAAGLSFTPIWTALGGAANRQLGYSLSGAGDVNGDGFGDLIIGVPGYSNGQSLEGYCAAYLGNQTYSRSATTRQYRSDLSTPVQTSNGTFQVDCEWGAGQVAWSTIGRSQVKLAWELKGHGPPFMGAPFSNWTGFSGQDAGWTDTGLSGVELKRVFSINDGSTAHPAWRVRVRHHPATMLDGRVFGRWFYHGLHDHQVPSVKTDLGPCGVLPVELIGQQARCLDRGVRLDWITGSERDCAGFWVERSTDADQWAPIDLVECAGTSYTVQDYMYEDPAPPPGVLYYRLRQVDVHGAETTYPTMALEPCGQANSNISAWPVPTREELNIALLRTGQLGWSSMQIFDATGRKAKVLSIDGSATFINVDVRGMAPGAYLVVVLDAEGGVVGRIPVALE